MSTTEILALFGVLSALAGGVAGFITATSAARKAAADVRKLAAEADNLVMDTATDAVTMIRGVSADTIKHLDARVADLERLRLVDKDEILALTRKLGSFRNSAEKQSRVIMTLRAEVCLWKERAERLVKLLRERGIPVPEWAGGTK